MNDAVMLCKSKYRHAIIKIFPWESLNFKYVLLFFLVLWLASFPAQGAVYQLSLYFIPILVIAGPKTRLIFLRMRKELLILTLILAVPMFFSEFRAFLSWGEPLSKDPFHAFWRLSLFPLALGTLCHYCGLSEEKLRHWCVFFFAIYASISLFYFLSQIGHGSGWRESGAVHNPNPFGFLMMSGCLLSLINMIRVSRYTFWLNLVAFTLFSVTALISGSRSAWLGGLIAFMVIIVLHRDFISRLCHKANAKVFILIALLIVSVVLFFFRDTFLYSNVSARIAEGFKGDIRLSIWQGYLTIVDQYPLIGRPITPEGKIIVDGNQYGPHNMYLSVLVESGFFGLFGLTIAIVRLGLKGLKLELYERSTPVSLLVILCVYCFFNSSFFGHVMTQSVFALIVAFITLHFLKKEVALICKE